MEQLISTTCCETEMEIRKKHNKIQIGCNQKDHMVRYFLMGVAVLTLISLMTLDIDWYKLLFRLPEIPRVFVKLSMFHFSKMDQIIKAFLKRFLLRYCPHFSGLFSV